MAELIRLDLRFDKEETEKIIAVHKEMSNRIKREGIPIEVSYQDVVRVAIRELKLHGKPDKNNKPSTDSAD